jgi:hypothetical protein
MVIASFEEPGDEGVIRKVASDLHAAKLPSDERQIRRVLEDLMSRAFDEIKAGL